MTHKTYTKCYTVSMAMLFVVTFVSIVGLIFPNKYSNLLMMISIINLIANLVFCIIATKLRFGALAKDIS